MQNTSYLAAGNAAVITSPIVSRSETNTTPFALDTTFVLFFLALDLGQAWLNLGFDGFLAGTTLLAFIVLPYFLPFAGERPAFHGWVAGRFVLAGFGLFLGLLMKQAVGVLLPGWFGFMPMTLLIVAAFSSLYFQVYGILRVRLAR